MGKGWPIFTDHKRPSVIPLSLYTARYLKLKNCDDFAVGRYECTGGDRDQFTLRLN